MKDKWALICGIFKKNISTDQSIYDYVSQRFSSNIAQCLVDPFITGIYAGDVKHLHMGCAFPKFGNKNKKGKKHKAQMRSFKNGMSQLIEALFSRYQEHIRTGMEINSLNDVEADAIIVSTPAYVASKIIEESNPCLASALKQIPYAPMAVAGLVFSKGSFKQIPDGFGYLIPSKEGKDILGVLIESNVYAGRGSGDHVMVRVMLGGMHHPAIINDNAEQILAKAVKEIDGSYGLKAGPIETFVKLWPKGIPQYELNYPLLCQTIAKELTNTPHLYLCANYLGGISFNQCINNAKSVASAMVI
jgi:oxygen-dependent protoporphyrinogen oxidase